jgi:hypothetical protein
MILASILESILFAISQRCSLCSIHFKNLLSVLLTRKSWPCKPIEGGGEYQKLNTFFTQIGISHRVSCPRTHQENGAVERKHRHIVKVGLPLLAHAHMPLKYWDDASATAAYLINRTPSKVISYQTPIQKLSGSLPDYSQMRVFDCACWPNLRPFNARKLAFSSQRCAFLGYNSLHKGYKCLDIHSGCVYISRDVVFDKAVFPFHDLNPNAGAQLGSDIMLLHLTLIPPKSWRTVGEAPANYPHNHSKDSVEIANESVEENISSQRMQDPTPATDPGARSDDDSAGSAGARS